MGTIITTDAKNIKVDFNGIVSVVRMRSATIPRASLTYVIHHDFSDMDYVEVGILGSQRNWQVTTNGANNTLPIGSVDGVVPTDNDHLETLINTLLP